MIIAHLITLNSIMKLKVRIIYSKLKKIINLYPIFILSQSTIDVSAQNNNNIIININININNE